MSHVRVRGFILCVLAVWLWAQSGAHTASVALAAEDAVVVAAGDYVLTEQMIAEALDFARYLAASDFSEADAAALREDLIAYFRKDPAKEADAYDVVHNLGLLRNRDRLASALGREALWDWFAKNDALLRELESVPLGRMVLKYNPVIVHAGRRLINRFKVDCLFASTTLVAEAAGVPPPTLAEKENFVRELPSSFRSMTTKEQEYLRLAESRYARFLGMYESSVNRLTIADDINRSVTSPKDAWRVARAVENDSLEGARYDRAYKTSIVVSTGGYQLTELMLEQGIGYAQYLAGGSFSAGDVAALRDDLIAYFRREPATQAPVYEALAARLQKLPNLLRHPDPLVAALGRESIWEWYAKNPEGFQTFQSVPFGRMVLKYNPVIVNSGGMIINRVNVDSLLASNALIAKAAGISPPTQAERDEFLRDLPSKFPTLAAEEQQYLRLAESRLANFRQIYDSTRQIHAAITADIRKSVHSSEDAWREARVVENDSRSGYKYHRAYHGALAHALLAPSRIFSLGALSRSISKGSMIDVPAWR